ncbi:MAG: hypothetical protein JSU92_09125 [Deltaproteobacteria bacterium]|nr:MAG: hypothetical protein JSU92_09125 [Deltaproteobacteria bacterium]
MPAEEEIFLEEEKLRKLRGIADSTAYILRSKKLIGKEAWSLMGATKTQVLELFPDKEETFELIYKPRFLRIIWDNMF